MRPWILLMFVLSLSLPWASSFSAQDAHLRALSGE